MFFKKIKTYIGILLATAACISLAGCSQENTANTVSNIQPTNSPDVSPSPEASAADTSYIPSETVTLNMLSDLSSFQGIQPGWFAEVMEDKFNVKLDILMTESDSTTNPYDGSYDFIISGSTLSESFLEAMSKGYFLDWNNFDTEKYMPYISKNLEDSYVCHSDENSEYVYGIYTSTSLPGDHTDPIYSWELRYDYYEELGKPEITDINDWVAVLEQIKENHPVNADGEEVYAISYHNEWNDSMLFDVQSLVCAYYGYEVSGTGFYDYENHQYYGCLSMDDSGNYGPYLQMLQLSNELYRKGLLNPSSETSDYNNAIHKLLATDRLFASLASYSGSAINDKMYPVIPKEAKPLTYELGHLGRRCISIDSGTKYPELCMAILDYFYSPEGMLTMLYGPKVECWNYNEDGLTYLTEFGLACLYERYTPRGDLYFSDGMPMFNISPYNILSKNPESGEPYAFDY